MSAHEFYSPEDDDAAFAAVYRAHSQKLLRYCQYRLRDRHEAEDVVQEAFARAWRTMPVGGPDGSFYPWLRVVAGNLCTDILRKRARSQPVALIEPGVVDGGMDDITDECDRVLVRQALGRLNDRHRSALMMREDEGLSYDQIAERTGATAGTVESLLWRARQALKREFTVLAGTEGCLAAVPFVVLLAGRGRDAGRRAWGRVLRRLAAFHPRGDTPLAHAAMAAAAALTVVSGVAVTVGLGEGGDRRHSVVVPGQFQNISSTLPAPAGPAPSTTPAPTAVPGATDSASTGSIFSVSGPASPAATSAPASTPPRIRVVSPVAVGRSAAGYAGKSPVVVGVGQLTIGVSPPAVATYVQGLAQRAAPSVSSSASALKENHP